MSIYIVAYTCLHDSITYLEKVSARSREEAARKHSKLEWLPAGSECLDDLEEVAFNADAILAVIEVVV